jgi:hypothetical protein
VADEMSRCLGEPIEGGSLGGAWDLDGVLGHVRGIPASAPVKRKGPPREVALRTKTRF